MKPSSRIQITVVFFFVIAASIIGRLFKWQIIQGPRLSILAASQRESVSEINPVRGNILASDGFPLAINQEAFLLFANPQKINEKPEALAKMLAPILAPGLDEVKVATDATAKEKEKQEEDLIEGTESFLQNQLSKKDLVWVLLSQKVPAKKKEALESLNIEGLGFQPQPLRIYPEASMAAHLIGFVGMDDYGKDTGYFGLEGFYELDLSGRVGIIKEEKDAVNRPIPIGKFWQQKKKDGRHLQLYIDRGIQYLIENELKEAINHYEAKSGSVVVMDPKTGGIIAMASFPAFDPKYYKKYDYENFVNPIVSKVYEPGSTFKILTMAAGIDLNKITPNTKCDICDKPYKIDKYFIRTWNNKYYKDSNMVEVLAHSDNVGMVFVANKLGLDNFLNYIKNFGIGERTSVDLQGEVAPPLRDQWSEVDLLTAAFGQGLVVTPIQMVTAVGAVANKGRLLEPRIVKTIIDNKREIEVQPKFIRQVITPQTASIVTEMMVAAVNYGDAKWAVPRGYRIAGKTGTAQVSVGGAYDEEKTIASFIGFAPADDPKFVMLTIIEEPKTSQWGSETAAPLFFSIAKKLFIHLGIPATE
jgi:cell division protein FtsI/penicillin-binding protein 2